MRVLKRSSSSGDEFDVWPGALPDPRTWQPVSGEHG